MPANRQFLIAVTVICMAAPLVSLGVRLWLGWSLLAPLMLAGGVTAPLAIAWFWQWRGWRGSRWVEVAVYVSLLAVGSATIAVNILGVFYIVPFVGIIYRDLRVSFFGAILSVAAIWILVLGGITPVAVAPNVAQLATHTFLVLAFTLIHRHVIALVERQEQELVIERTLSQTRLVEHMANQWALTVEARSPYTGGHVHRVTAYALVLAPEVPGLNMDLKTFRLACILHDVGKIAVPDSILNKAGPLLPEEYRNMKSHPSTGSDLVLRTGAGPDVVAAVRHHHERWDGKGYPDGLNGEVIPMPARVLAVADAFDAMTSHRPYRPAMSPEQALGELLAGAGTQFDPKVVALVERVFPQWVGLQHPKAHSA